ncbi:MAG: hypothetical protein KZQ77_06845 [Candidatus Thiodiazotropha sp. (ex Notomyrtea botanica)]|nr:hypothetical protein [Candidatus Thiodiazotropha sp. (ex Notomyrtea botanica)]
MVNDAPLQLKRLESLLSVTASSLSNDTHEPNIQALESTLGACADMARSIRESLLAADRPGVKQICAADLVQRINRKLKPEKSRLCKDFAPSFGEDGEEELPAIQNGYTLISDGRVQKTGIDLEEFAAANGFLKPEESVRYLTLNL